MKLQLKNTLSALLLSALMTGAPSANRQPVTWNTDYVAQPQSAGTDTLPEMGTAAGSTLSIAQENQMGDFYVRQMRDATPVINDPLLEKYINQLGIKLVSNANSVKTPFHFYIVNNNELNAFAFFGGNVVVHSGIFRYTENESQLASVLSHEISHVTQRHLARAMEDQQKNSPLLWGGALGSAILAAISPQAGMAALTSTMATSQQGMISFTQANEQEADRLGIQVLARAGYDTQAMPDFLQKLADQSRGAATLPEMLLTHPLPDSRLSDTRNRASQYPRRTLPQSLEFLLAKVRVMTMYGGEQGAPAADEYLAQLSSGTHSEQLAAKYGQAIQDYQAGKYTQAATTLKSLLAEDADNAWYLDVATDVDIARQQTSQAVKRLEASKDSDNPVLILNLANALLENHEASKAQKILDKYTFTWPGDVNAWELAEKAAALQRQRAQELAARAETLALKGKLTEAINLLNQAGEVPDINRSEQERYDARIDQLHKLRKTFHPYETL